MVSKRSNNELFKYGICLNDECSKCKSKEIQKIPFRKELICEECGKELRECNPPKKKNNKILLIILCCLVIAIIGVVVLWTVDRKDKETEKTITVDKQSETEQISNTIVADTIQSAQTEENESDTMAIISEQPVEKKTAKVAENKCSLDYGKWSGEWKSGKPHGTGTMKYTKKHLIDARDPQKRTAESGDYIIGEFYNGRLVQGVWYDCSNNVKGSVIIGM